MLLIHDEDELPENPCEEEIMIADSIGDIGLNNIDDRILNALSDRWEKAAKVIFDVMHAGGFEFSEELVDLHARRVIYLNELGKLSSSGNLRKPRFSEIRCL